MPGQPRFGSVWHVANAWQYGGDPSWHPEPPSATHPLVLLEDAPPEVLAARPVLQVAPRSTKPQPASPLTLYTNSGATPKLDAGSILVGLAFPVDSQAFGGFTSAQFVCDLPLGVLERLRAIKRFARLPY